MDAFVHRRAIDRTTYDDQIERVNAEIADLRLDLREAEADELKVESLIDYVEKLLASAATMWLGFPIDQKQRLQKLIFPEGCGSRAGNLKPRAVIVSVL